MSTPSKSRSGAGTTSSAQGSKSSATTVSGSQQSTSSSTSGGQGQKMVAMITSADSLAGATLINNLSQQGATRYYEKITLVVGKGSQVNEKADVSQLRNIANVMQVDMTSPDSSTMTKSMQGVDVLVLIPPADDVKFTASRMLLQVADQCKIGTVVLMSWTGTNAIESAQGSFTMLGETKKLEEEFKSKYNNIQAKVIVRTNFYVQNLVTYAEQILKQGVLPIPTADGKFAPVDVEAVGQAMAKLMAETAEDTSKHADQVYTLTGTSAVDAEGIAKALSQALDKTVKAKQITMDEARNLLSSAKPSLAKSEIDTIIETYTLVKQSRLDEVSNNIRDLGVTHLELVDILKRDAPMMMKVVGQ